MYQSFELQLPDWYKNNNPNIIRQIKSDLKAGKQFNYLFMGCVGSGKTVLAKLIYSQIDKRNIRSVYFSANSAYKDYLNVLTSNFTDKAEALRKRQSIFNTELAVLDDLGAEKPQTVASTNFLASLIEDKYDYMKKNSCCSIITTNLNGEMIKKTYGERVLDRLHESFIIMQFNQHYFRREYTKIVKG